MATHCPHCKAPILVASAINCTHCGVALAGATVDATAKPAAAQPAGGLKGFLRENWLWIVAPIVIALIAVLLVVVVFDGDDSSAFIYNIF